MILVVDTGYASFAGTIAGTNWAAPTTAFEQVMLKELIPMIDATAFNKKVKLLWFSAGTAEERFHSSTVAIHEALNQAGIRNVLYSSPGTDHERQTWRRSLHNFVPRLFRD